MVCPVDSPTNATINMAGVHIFHNATYIFDHSVSPHHFLTALYYHYFYMWLACYFLYYQEVGNVPYVVDAGFGVYVGGKPGRIADAVVKLLQNDTALSVMRANTVGTSGLAQRHSQAALNTARSIGVILQSTGNGDD
jgi:hypothetical protein